MLTWWWLHLSGSIMITINCERGMDVGVPVFLLKKKTTNVILLVAPELKSGHQWTSVRLNAWPTEQPITSPVAAKHELKKRSSESENKITRRKKNKPLQSVYRNVYKVFIHTHSSLHIRLSGRSSAAWPIWPEWTTVCGAPHYVTCQWTRWQMFILTHSPTLLTWSIQATVKTPPEM